MNNNQRQILRVLLAAKHLNVNLSSKQISQVLEDLLGWWNVPRNSVAGYLGFMKPYVYQKKHYTGKTFYSKRMRQTFHCYTTTWHISSKGKKYLHYFDGEMNGQTIKTF
ncbi:hypothetical protein [Caulobacter phage Cr30]|uniref:hypothetical protein n=1 Tax=Caulobacter phage Cr30 TaxID=1357714 RepID=UPI0004A9BB7E|nr:hypothetical protein OZ74_gp124 [Caulobacter phage Cr30]AGS81009.1 hypothetical protein [Caulobacter phage Cr30]